MVGRSYKRPSDISQLKSASKTKKTMLAKDYVKSQVSESDIQSALFKELTLHMHTGLPLSEYFYAVPNGGFRHKTTARKLKAEGVKAGVPDIHCFIASGAYHSLYIEMKTATGELTDSQKKIIPILRSQGHKVVVCRSVAEAMQEIFKYLGRTRSE